MGIAKNGQRFVFGKDIDGVAAGDGVTRKVLAYCDEAMCVANEFKKGAVGKLHSHPHTQVTYVASGAFEFEIDGEAHVVRQGDSLLKQNGVAHGAKCLEDGVLVDFFSPKRDDFI